MTFKSRTFLRWWIIFCLSLFGVAGLYWTGFFDYLWATDLSKLSFLILGMFFACSVYIGKSSYDLFKGHYISEHKIKPLWYFAEAMVALGLVGTLVGFFWVLTHSFGTLDIGNTESIKLAMKEIGNGAGTSILTSLVGIPSSIITKMQLVNLEHGNDVPRKKKSGKNDAESGKV